MSVASTSSWVYPCCPDALMSAPSDWCCDRPGLVHSVCDNITLSLTDHVTHPMLKEF